MSAQNLSVAVVALYIVYSVPFHTLMKMESLSWSTSTNCYRKSLTFFAFNLFSFHDQQRSNCSIAVSAFCNILMILQAIYAGYEASRIYGEVLGDMSFVTFLVNLIEAVLTVTDYLMLLYVGMFKRPQQRRIVQKLDEVENIIRNLNQTSARQVKCFHIENQKKYQIYNKITLAFYSTVCVIFIIIYNIDSKSFILHITSVNFLFFAMVHMSLVLILNSIIEALAGYFLIINFECDQLKALHIDENMYRKLIRLVKIHNNLTELTTDFMAQFGVVIAVSYIYLSVNTTVQLFMVFVLLSNKDLSLLSGTYACLISVWIIPMIMAIHSFSFACTRLLEIRKNCIASTGNLMMSFLDKNYLELTANGFLVVDESRTFRVSLK